MKKWRLKQCTEAEGRMRNEAGFWVAYIPGAKTNIKTKPHAKQKVLFFPLYSWPQTTKFPSVKTLCSSTNTHSRLISLPLVLGTITDGSLVHRSAWWKSKMPIPHWASRHAFFSSCANKWPLQYTKSHCPSDIHHIDRASLSLKYFSSRK